MAQRISSKNNRQGPWFRQQLHQFIFVITSFIIFSQFGRVQMSKVWCINGTLSTDLVTIQSIPQNSSVRLFQRESYLELQISNSNFTLLFEQQKQQFEQSLPYNLSKPLEDGIHIFGLLANVAVCQRAPDDEEILCNIWSNPTELPFSTRLILPNNTRANVLGFTSYTNQDIELASASNNNSTQQSDKYVAIAYDKHSNKIYQIKESNGSYGLKPENVIQVTSNFSFESIVTGDDQYFLYHPNRYCIVKSLLRFNMDQNQTDKVSLVECNQDNIVETNLFNCQQPLDYKKQTTTRVVTQFEDQKLLTSSPKKNESSPSTQGEFVGSLNPESTSKRTIIISVVVIIVIVAIVLIVLTSLHIMHEHSKSTQSVNPNNMKLKFKSPSSPVPGPSGIVAPGQQSSTSFPPEFVKPHIAQQPHLNPNTVQKQSDIQSSTSNGRKSVEISQKSKSMNQQPSNPSGVITSGVAV